MSDREQHRPGLSEDPRLQAERSRRRGLETVAGALARSPRVDVTILAARYGLDGHKPQTLKEIANTLGVSPEGARQRQLRAENRLAEELAKDWAGYYREAG